MVGGYEYKYGQIFATMIYKFALLQSYLAILQTKSTRSEYHTHAGGGKY